MKTSLNLNWIDNMAFESEINGHKLVIDADPAVGGNNTGPRPKPLMLLALAGCTGMDVVSILKKMRVEIEKFNVEIIADLTEEHPKHFYKMHVIYKFWGKDLPLDKLEKAVKLSDEQYCGVSAVYKKALELTHEIQVNP
ncbi:MAG: osmotically inducible protein C [Bacteroidetes bacterium GWC2_33_15]|nr:MAG: osmotically inducible protein C [Bacteroidetes bacterium GWA2_33_15]OFX50813.1 MAG: osmotically inducible protein C [Bacteroidetes bacterium GWC2_33_15]OFX62904.1 MAG: osmotically inducible protein C [Bacteroidetes bacterium GWB2_32_14]OFX69974.1 MAG: osmotically inducible protein C [Bacteroidetes bacterium GWD2_33_33]HAN18969.1 osmotically inducible protein C [Bacteroidales bacterium]